MDINAKEKKIKEDATKYANKIKKKQAKELTCKNKYPPEENPVSVFMAGSPGAGKTEFAKSLLKQFESTIIHIDIDEYRKFFSENGYNGQNSYLFQLPTSTIANKIHDLALDNKQSFIFDSTMKFYDQAKKNIERSVKRGRDVIIYFIYKNPENAWHYVKQREISEGRKVPQDVFAEAFVEVQKTVDSIRDEFKGKVKVLLSLEPDTNSEPGCRILPDHRQECIEVNDALKKYIKESYTT